MKKLILLVLFFSMSAMAWEEGDDNSVDNRVIDNSVDADAESSSVSASSSESQAISESSNGDQISMNSSQFYALSLQFPQASGCFSGAQAGGNDNNDSAFLGIHILNKSCWMDKLASHEPDIEINARLKCGDKHYRNAVAYDVPRKERQAKCIEMKISSGQAQMANYVSEINQMKLIADREKERLDACHDRIDEANERTERCDTALKVDDK